MWPVADMFNSVDIFPSLQKVLLDNGGLESCHSYLGNFYLNKDDLLKICLLVILN